MAVNFSEHCMYLNNFEICTPAVVSYVVNTRTPANYQQHTRTHRLERCVMTANHGMLVLYNKVYVI